MTDEEFRKAKFGFISYDGERMVRPDRKHDIPAVITEKVPFIKKGTEIVILGRDLQTDKLVFFLPTMGYKKVHHSKINLMNKNKPTKAEELLEEIKTAAKAEQPDMAATRLREYFKTVVAGQPELLGQYLEMRTLIRSNRKRPFFSYLDTEAVKLFLENARKHIWNLIPDVFKTTPKKIPNRSEFLPDPEDPKLKKIIAPFVGSDNLRINMMGVSFHQKGIAATDLHLLIHIPVVPKKKGLYCMTRKCFKEINGKDSIDASFPEYTFILPQAGNKYQTFELEIEVLRKIISTLKKTGIDISADYRGTPVLQFKYGKGNDHIQFNTKIIKTVLETFASLEHASIKIWIRNNTSGAAFTGVNVTREELDTHATIIVLAMPMMSSGILRMLPVYDLVESSLSFGWNDAEPIVFTSPPFTGRKFITKKSSSAGVKRLKLAIAKASAQKQRIRILELETVNA